MWENLKKMRSMAEELRRKGWAIYCPADTSFYATGAVVLLRKDAQRENLQQLTRCLSGAPLFDAVILMDGWKTSYGCFLEVCIARELGIPVVLVTDVLNEKLSEVKEQVSWSFESESERITHLNWEQKYAELVKDQNELLTQFKTSHARYQALASEVERLEQFARQQRGGMDV